jgi:Recombination endonuclease VII
MPRKIKEKPTKVRLRCSECGKYKELKEFGNNYRGKYGKNSKCFRCKRGLMYLRMYGIGVEYFEKILKRQHNACAICKKEFNIEVMYNPKTSQADKPVLDHDHASTQPRGVLCQKCNTALGIIDGRDEWLTSALDYLKEYQDDTKLFYEQTKQLLAGVDFSS